MHYRSFRSVAWVGLLLASLILSPSGTAFAQSDNTRLMVPEVPQGLVVSGCYSSVGRLYGRYNFDFCLERRGTYSVRATRLRCDGQLTWHVSGVSVVANLRRTSCGRGVNWTADSFRCRANLARGIISALLGQNRPLLQNLNCDYTPARGSGRGPTSFAARRAR